MKRIVKVSESNIRLGRKNAANGMRCIIYRALRTAFKSKVSYCAFSYFVLSNGQHVTLPGAAKQIQRQVFAKPDRTDLKPFKFTVNF